MDIGMVFDAESSTIRDCIETIQKGGASIAFAVDSSGILTGVVTDGDIRRAWLAGYTLSDRAEHLVQRAPLTVGAGESRTAILDLMQSRGISQVPVVDKDGHLLGVHLMREFLGQVARDNVAVVLAGGRGTRLLPVTSEVPKPMIPVAGRPILERIVTHLVGFGVTRIVLAVGYKSEIIETHFGTGERYGCRISYLREDPERPLGTGGPLALLPEILHGLTEPVIVLNGDLITQFDVSSLLEHHSSERAIATVGTFTYAHEVPFGVLQTDHDGMVKAIAEKPLRLETVSAGIYALDPEVLGRIPRGEFVPITSVIAEAIERGDRVSTWDCGQDWIDVGRPQDLARARGEL